MPLAVLTKLLETIFSKNDTMNCRHLLLLALWTLVLSAQELVPTVTVDDLQGDLQIQEWMRELRRVKRAPTRNDESRRYGSSAAVVLSANGTGRCVISADQASHFCGMEEEGKR
ncbi:unnamed protein product [Haemonchus placei]|uniref:Secreted protein n=1 Tax=Haemonchus placei TaxID=6290 RepID=A0A0N4WCJ7_HAEPC|nr:unnamed protein product [Haemonchus placei]